MYKFLGTSDFLAVSYYTSYQCTNGRDLKAKIPFQDANFIAEIDKTLPRSPTAPWLRVVPQGFRDMLLWMKREYDNPPVFIAENGYSDTGELNDWDRIEYFKVRP